MKIQYCVFAFCFVKIKLKSKLFVLKNEILTSLIINSIFSKLIILQIFLTMNHFFMNLNYFSWFFQIRMKTKRRLDIKSFMIKNFLKMSWLNTFEKKIIKKISFKCDVNSFHCRSRFNTLMINFCKFFLLSFCSLSIVIKRFIDKMKNYVLFQTHNLLKKMNFIDKMIWFNYEYLHILFVWFWNRKYKILLSLISIRLTKFIQR